jgi:hypothetical protein
MKKTRISVLTLILVLAAVSAAAFWFGSRKDISQDAPDASVREHAHATPATTDALTPLPNPQGDFKGVLDAPGPATRVHRPTPVTALEQPLAPRMEGDLAQAMEGDAEVAHRLARELAVCARYADRLNELSAAMTVAESMQRSEQEIRAYEEITLAYIERFDKARSCDGATEFDRGLISELLTIAVKNGNISAIPEFLEQGLSRERLLDYLRDPAAKEEFRRNASDALEAGVRSCSATSAHMMSQLFGDGIIFHPDGARAFAYELMANWMDGTDPVGSLRLQRLRESLSYSAVNQAIGFARQGFDRYCR